jgi:pimeloyl-ACP methyl ester carboxylesterase
LRRPWLIGALALLAGSACTREKPPLAAAPPASAATAEGSPQVADSADGVHIEYQIYGHGDPAIVLVHGWLNNANYWNAQLDDLKVRYTVVTLNLAGHGASDKNRSDWSIANYAQDVVAVVRQIPNSKLVLVGHAMGAPIVLDAAGRIGANFIGHMHEFVGQYLFTKDANPAFVRKVADDMALASPEVGIGSLEALYRYDFGAVLPEIKVPIIAINSDLNMRTDEARIKKSAPTFRAIVVPGSGHFLMMEAPQLFNPILLQAIESLVTQQ